MIFHVSRADGTLIGEFEERGFQEKIFANEIEPEHLYWHEGMADWKPVSEYRAPARETKIIAPPPLPVVRLLPISDGITQKIER